MKKSYLSESVTSNSASSECQDYKLDNVYLSNIMSVLNTKGYHTTSYFIFKPSLSISTIFSHFQVGRLYWLARYWMKWTKIYKTLSSLRDTNKNNIHPIDDGARNRRPTLRKTRLWRSYEANWWFSKGCRNRNRLFISLENMTFPLHISITAS